MGPIGLLGLMGLMAAGSPPTGAGALPEPTSYQAAGWLLVALGALITAMNQAHAFWQRAKDKPSPSEVATEAQQTFATQKDCQTRHQTLDTKVKELAERVEDHRDHGDESRRVLHNKIDSLKTSMHEMEKGLLVKQAEMEERISTKTAAQVGAVHDRVNVVLASLSEMRGEIKNMHTRANKS